MSMFIRFTPLAICIAASIAAAQSPIRIRELGPAEVASSETLGFVNGVRELSDGRVVVNDAGRRRLLAFDKSLATAAVFADTSSGKKTQYGPRSTGIIPYGGDSTLLIDGVGRAFLVLDPSGSVARVMSAPRPNDLGGMMGAGIGAVSIDRAGRLIYRTVIMPAFRAPIAGKPYAPPVMPDSAPLLRVDFDTRVADTIAWLRVAHIKVNTIALPNGGVTLTPVFSPISTIDDWTALPDGSVAIIRGSDYHLDWIGADNKRWSTPKIPFDWKRLSDDDKATLIDSARKALERQAKNSSAPAGVGTPGPSGHGGASIPAGHSMTIMPVGGDDGAPPPQSANKGPSLPQVAELVEPTDLPDYYPPILQTGEVKADLDGNVWILPSTSAQAGRGLVYDVVNRRGELVERVRLQPGRILEGFGANGAVYLTWYAAGGARLERTRLHR